MTGESVLRALVAECDAVDARFPLEQGLESAASAARLAALIGEEATSRLVAARLRELQAARLVVGSRRARRLKSGRIRTYSGYLVWSPTRRGREVDRILDEVTAERGGSFRPRVDAGISASESHALGS